MCIRAMGMKGEMALEPTPGSWKVAKLLCEFSSNYLSSVAKGVLTLAENQEAIYAVVIEAQYRVAI